MNRKQSVDREAKSSRVLVAHGEINQNDRHLVKQFLARLGLESEFMTEDQYKGVIKQHQPPRLAPLRQHELEESNAFRHVESITSRDAFVLREHFDDFRNRTRADFEFSLSAVTAAFNSLVDGLGDNRMRSWESQDGQRVDIFRKPHPLKGIIVKPRSGLGLPPYNRRFTPYGKSNEAATYSIQAGSLISFAETEGLTDGYQELSEPDQFLLAFTTQLVSQIEDL
ncbi:MAG TPA: hypothetical protein VMR28_00940 [Candidatus Saccharimonadales bacterium]|nr:hypothetical protein [Candidatus Saccharimonadales bacterium]